MQYSQLKSMACVVLLSVWISWSSGCRSQSATGAVGPTVADPTDAVIESLVEGEHAAVVWSRLADRLVLYPISSEDLRARGWDGQGETPDLRLATAAARAEVARLTGRANAWRFHAIETIELADPDRGGRHWLAITTWHSTGPALGVPPLRIPVFLDGVVPAAVMPAVVPSTVPPDPSRGVIL